MGQPYSTKKPRYAQELDKQALREELRKKAEWQRTIESPAAGTDYYLPETGGIDFSEWSVVSWVAKGDQPCDLIIEISKDGVNFTELQGYDIAAANWSTTRWNNLHTDFNSLYGRMKVTTGGTPPSSLELVATARPI